MSKEFVPPQDIESEQAVLGSCIIDPEAAPLVVQQLSESDFYRPSHQHIYKAIAKLTQDGVTVDTLSLRTALQESGEIAKVGGIEYILSLSSVVASAANLELHLDAVKDAAERRYIAEAAIKAYNMARKPSYKPEQARLHLEELLRKSDSTKKVWLTTSEVLAMVQDEVSFNTGLRVVDECGGGVMCGLNMLCGGPGAGKSTLALQIIKEALVAGHPSCIMGRDQKLSGQAQFMWSNHTQTPISMLNEFSDSYFTVSGWPLEWYTGKFDLASIISQMRLKAARGIRWFMVDYLGLIQYHERGMKPYERKCVVAEELAALSHELSLYVMLISRSTKVADGETPELRHVEGEAGVGNAADQVWYLRKASKDDPTDIDIGFLKSRQAYTGWEKLRFNGVTHSFSNWLPDGIDESVPDFSAMNPGKKDLTR